MPPYGRINTLTQPKVAHIYTSFAILLHYVCMIKFLIESTCRAAHVSKDSL